MTEQDVEVCPACGTPFGSETAGHFGYELKVCPLCRMWTWTDKSAADYDEVYATNEYEETQITPLKSAGNPEVFLSHGTYAPFFRQVPYRPNASLLDVGCGVGRFLIAARSIGWTTRGVDVSEKAVQIGRTEAGLQLSCETLEELLSAGARFDAVTAFEVLEHVPDPMPLVQLAMKLLNEGGWFFCTVPNRESPTVLHTRRPDWLPPIHLQFYTESAVRAMLQRAGGQEVRTGLIRAESIPRRFVGKVKRAVKRWLIRQPPDPLGIWGMARRKAS
jgi:SAM-dependent methyltransferase